MLRATFRKPMSRMLRRPIAICCPTRTSHLLVPLTKNLKDQVRFHSTSQKDGEITGIVDLMREVARQQQENVAKVVPWFVNNMPPGYFTNVPEHVRLQHLKAVASINDLGEADLKLSIRTTGDNTISITKIRNQTLTGTFFEQIRALEVPDGYVLNNVHIYSTIDDRLALNIFDFQKEDTIATKGASAEELVRF